MCTSRFAARCSTKLQRRCAVNYALLSAASATLTLLRLTSAFAEGDGRFVHYSDGTLQDNS